MICINPDCHESFDQAGEHCPHCGTIVRLADRYELWKPLRKLTRVNPVSVFLGFDHQTQREVVIKVLDYPEPEYLRHFEREAGALGNIQHPGIPKVDIDDGGYFTVSTTSDRYRSLTGFAMEKVPGVTLESFVEQHGKIAQSQAIAWLSELTDIIAALHDRQVFHRDIKPSNIIVRPDGSLALIDFGAVREISKTYLVKMGKGADEVTQKNEITIFASAAYTAYEQLQGRAMPQSDFFSLGRTIVYALTGVSPIKLDEDSAGKLLWRNLAPQVNRPFADLLDRLMSLLPIHRPRNTQEIKEALSLLPRQIRREKVRSSWWFKGLGIAAITVSLLGLAKGYTWYLSDRYLNTGLKLALDGRYSEAKAQFESAILYSPNDPNLYGNLAVICQQINSDSGRKCAIDAYQKALSQKGQVAPEIRYNLANLYEESGDFKQAIATYEGILKDSPDFVLARNNLARLYILNQQYDAVEQLLTPALIDAQAIDKKGILLKNLGWVQYERKQYVEAAKSLKAAIALNPEETSAHCLLAQVFDASPKLGTSDVPWQACLSGTASTPEVESWQSQKLQQLFDPKGQIRSRI